MKKNWTLRNDAGEIIDSSERAIERIAGQVGRAKGLAAIAEKKEEEEKSKEKPKQQRSSWFPNWSVNDEARAGRR